MNSANLAFVLFGLALAISVVCIAALRRRTADVCALAEKLAREMEEHRESEERYRLLIKNAPDAIITLDVQGNFTTINPFCETLTDWTRNELIGKPFLAQVHAEDVANVKASLADALNARKAPTVDARVLIKSGEYLWMEFIMTPQCHHQQIDGVLAIGRDISARHRVARAQEALELQLRRGQKMEAIGRLAGGIAHDFNNFLTIIMANCGLARMDIVGFHPVAERLDQISRASQRAAALVQQILTFSSSRE